MAKKPKNSEARQRAADEADPHKEAMLRYERALQRERDNIDQGMEDLAFYAGTQWPQELLSRRELEDRPALTFNRLPQFVHQVTGDIRQMRPAIHCVGIDTQADDETAEVLEGLIRYIENRSDATHVYPAAADAQVTCGMGAWRVKIEYADETTFNKELGIELIEDGLSVLFDPDAAHPTRKDSMFCFVPVDMTRAKFNEMFPDYQAASIDPLNIKSAPVGWFSEDVVRVAEYWYKVPVTKTLALTPDGTIVDVSDDPQEAKLMQQMGAKIEKRPGYDVRMRYMTGISFVKPVGQDEEEIKWPGRYIPIIPALGEEIRIGRRRVRWGLVRAMKDPQRLYNFMRSAQAEVVSLQPKAPFMVTEDNVRDYEGVWQTANTKAHAYLPYKPDPKNGGQAPQRVPPPIASQGLAAEVQSADNDLHNVTGLYNPSLGAPSNETSGVAIQRRQQEGDTGTFIYIKNFSLAVGHTGRVLLDLIPHIYDTQRTVRIIGEDGKTDMVQINQPQGLAPAEGADPDIAADLAAVQRVKNDLTVGAYDVHMEMGPAYSTKRQEMRDGMQAFMQTSPNTATMVLDIFAKAQDWPMADKIAKRLHHLLPPQIQAEEAKEQNDPSLMPPPPPPPSPQEQAEAMKAQAEVARSQAEVAKARTEIDLKQLELRGKELDNLKREFEVVKAQLDISANGPPIDSNQLHAWIGQIDEAMQLLTEHIATGIPMPGGDMQQQGQQGQPPQEQQPEPPQEAQQDPNEGAEQPEGGSPPPDATPQAPPMPPASPEEAKLRLQEIKQRMKLAKEMHEMQLAKLKKDMAPKKVTRDLSGRIIGIE